MLRFIKKNCQKDRFEGKTIDVAELSAHQLEALVDNSSITEVSTADSVEDNYRIVPGDSQKVITPEPHPNVAQ